MSQDRARASLGSPHATSHPSASAYSYGQNIASSMPSGFGVGPGQALNDSLTQSRPQYQPGYLLSLAQSQAMPMTGQRHEEPLLIPTRAKMSSTYPRNDMSDFGSDSMFETTSKCQPSSLLPHVDFDKLLHFNRHRHREAADDEDGPPTSSVVDIVNEVYVDSHRQLLNNPRRSVSTHKNNNEPTSPSATPHQTLYIVVFGYPPSRYSSTVAHFQSIADGGTTEPEHSLDVENAFKIGYRQPWEAARAWRRNGEVISGEGGRWMVGVKWTDPVAAEQVLGSGARISPNSPPITGPEIPLSSSQERMDASPDTADSQLQHVSAPQHESAPSVGTPIKLAPSASAFRKATPDLVRKGTPVQMHSTSRDSPGKSKGMFGQVSDLVFGW